MAIKVLEPRWRACEVETRREYGFVICSVMPLEVSVSNCEETGVPVAPWLNRYLDQLYNRELERLGLRLPDTGKEK